MSTDTFEQDLAARMGAASDTIGAAGVTREGIDERLAARRAARRRRQGGLVLAAAVLVVVAGIGAIAIGSSDESGSPVVADGGGTTEAPTSERPGTTCYYDTTPDGTGWRPVDGDCVDDATTTAPDTEPSTSIPPETSPVPTDPEPTTTAPPTTAPPATDPPTTTAPALTPGQPCTLGSDPDCVDPDGDGQASYLIGGADCMEALSPEIEYMCTDLDGDGDAGYPDEGEG